MIPGVYFSKSVRGSLGPLAASAALVALIALIAMTVFPGSARAEPNQMIYQLTHLRGQVMMLEKDLIEGLKQQRQAKANAARMQKLIGLQRKERELGKKRLGELEATVMELEARRSTLSDKVRTQQLSVRKSLAELGRSLEATPTALGVAPGAQGEALEAPRRKLLARFADRGIREIEELKIDLSDAEQLESRIQEEKQQLAYLFQDLQEQESVMALNRMIQLELFKKRHEERVSQLESYRKLKSSESQVERLIGQFNSRKELQRQVESDRAVSQNIALDSAAGLGGAFAKLKGRLPLPVADARLVAGFGRNFDPKSKLFIFKKGVDLAVGKNTSVRSIYPGKIAYSGELPEYGRVTIVDHGDHFYSLCAHLGELSRKTGDAVAAGDVIGLTEESGNPLYFEIRARNVAVNPLQWVSNSFTLKE